MLTALRHYPGMDDVSASGVDWRPSASLANLRRRAACLERTRHFFAEKGVLEVETPVAQGGANLDPGIEPIRLGQRFLVTSPEHHLKRLLAAGSGDVWALTPVFRAGELGRWHNPEFRMLEWYRLGWDDARMADETVALLDAVTGLGSRVERLSYGEAFHTRCGWDPFTVDDLALFAAAQAQGLDAPAGRQELLDLLLATVVQPTFPTDRWTVLVDWPPAQAAQARLRQDRLGRHVAARFEVYRGALELANGYWECTGRAELAARQSPLTQEGALVPDARYYAALDHGLPVCAGVAVGFDRAVALACGAGSVADVISFSWNRA